MAITHPPCPLDIAPLALLSAALVLGGCGPDAAPLAGPCDGKNRPAFRLVITGSGAELPRDLVIRVRYGGGSEDYQLADPSRAPRVVFCSPATVDGGTVTQSTDSDAGLDGGAPAEPSGLEGLSCELWTSGAASVTVEGTGFRSETRRLEAEIDNVCNDLVTRTVTLDLVSLGR